MFASIEIVRCMNTLQLTNLGYAMAISSVSSAAATQAVRPPQEATKVTEPTPVKSESDSTKAAEVQQPRPTVNTNGQTVGTLVNVTA